jgi:hypothetical protein
MGAAGLNARRRTVKNDATSTAARIHLIGPVEVVVRTKAQCRDDPDLRAFSVHDGPAAAEVQGIVSNLVSGEAVPQTVVMLKEEGSSQVLGLISVRLEGRWECMMPGAAPSFVQKLAASTYVNALARDDRFEGAVLADGKTHLGFATVLAGVELASVLTGTAPEMWALVKKTNGRSKRALKGVGFHRGPHSDKFEVDVFVRRAGLPLPPVPPRSAYRPLRVRGPQHDHPLAA